MDLILVYTLNYLFVFCVINFIRNFFKTLISKNKFYYFLLNICYNKTSYFLKGERQMDKEFITYIFQTVSECNTLLECALRNKNDRMISMQFSNQAFFCIKQLQNLVYSNKVSTVHFNSYYQYFLFLNKALLENSVDNQHLTQEYSILKSKCKDFEDNLNFMVKQDITASENMFFI